MRMNATCRNLHMCNQYEIFTSYKIAKEDRYCWIVSLIQNRNCLYLLLSFESIGFSVQENNFKKKKKKKKKKHLQDGLPTAF